MSANYELAVAVMNACGIDPDMVVEMTVHFEVNELTEITVKRIAPPNADAFDPEPIFEKYVQPDGG